MTRCEVCKGTGNAWRVDRNVKWRNPNMISRIEQVLCNECNGTSMCDINEYVHDGGRGAGGTA